MAADSSTDETTASMGDETAADPGSVAQCGLAAPCSDILLDCGESPACDMPLPPAMTCALEMLAAREPGYIYFYFNGQLTGEVDWLDIAVLTNDGTARRQYTFVSPSDCSALPDTPLRCTLKPVEWFEACLDPAADGETLLTCHDPFAWFESDCKMSPACE